MRKARIWLVGVLCVTALAAWAAAAQAPAEQPPAQQPVAAAAAAASSPALRPQSLVEKGIRVEFDVEPLPGPDATPAALRGHLLENQNARIRFRITDATGAPLNKLFPVAWVDPRTSSAATDEQTCRRKVTAFLQGSLRTRPAVDLNSYYVLALNDDPSITVIDPQIGFSDSKLFGLVTLKSRGEDWAISRDGRLLFVTLPEAGQVAVVDLYHWKVTAYLDAGPRPTRIRLQPDGRYLWVVNDAAFGEDGAGGVTVLDAMSLAPAGRVATGAGPHDVVITDDDRWAFITSAGSGAVSVVDVRALAVAAELRTGRRPVALAYSTLSQAVYVADEADGSVAVLDARRHEIIGRMEMPPGVRSVAISPDGRWGFAVNGRENAVHIFDAASNRLRYTVTVGRDPDQVVFTDTFAYVRSRGSALVDIIEWPGLATGQAPHPVDFPAGQVPPEKTAAFAAAAAIVPSPEGGAAMVVNPSDRRIYYYHEGMAAPNVSFQNYGKTPRAVLVAERNLRETEPGVYSTFFRVEAGGAYDVVFLLDSPRMVACFDLPVRPNPALKKNAVPIVAEHVVEGGALPAGGPARFRFRISASETLEPRADLADVRALLFQSPGLWQRRAWAQPVGQGYYEVSFELPQPGVYYLFLECPSLGVRMGQLAHRVLYAERAQAAQAAEKTAGGRP